MSIAKNFSFVLNGSAGNGTSDPVCNPLINADIFIHGSFGFAILMAIIYGFMEKRTTKYLTCCNGRPAIVVPINLLDDFHHRWVYACAFGAITNTIVIIFFGAGTYITFPGSTWGSVFTGLLISFEVCVNFSLFFFCINTRHKRAGNLIGLLYAFYWLLIFIAILMECADPIPDVIPYMGLVIELPCLLCLGVLIVRFFVMLIVAIVKCGPCKQDNNGGVNIMSSWQRNYVLDLLEDSPARRAAKEANQPEPTCCEKLQLWVTTYIWQRRPNFKYSSRILCTIFVVFCCSYQIGVFNVWANTVFLKWISGMIMDYIDDTNANSTLAEDVDFTLNTIYIFWNIVVVLSFSLFVINILLILGRYRFHMLKLYKGDTSFLPPAFFNNVRTDSAEIVRSCMMFSGYQIAFMIWGMTIVTYVLWLLALLFVFIIILPLYGGVTDVVQWLAEVLIIPSVLHFFLKVIQKVMARKLFLQEKLHETEKTQPMAIDNPRSFHVFNYFFFIANIQTGLFSCLYRILIGFVFGLVFLGRMDRCVLMERLEGSDKGYMAYLGMLYIEKTHNNPIMRLFCQILLESKRQKYRKSIDYGSISHVNEEGDKMKLDSEGAEDSAIKLSDIPFKPVYRVRNLSAFNRWHLAYTLVKNPNLAASRAHNLHGNQAEYDAKGAVNQRKYELYMKVKQQLATLEMDIYGKTIKEDGRRATSTQTDEVDEKVEVTVESNVDENVNTEL